MALTTITKQPPKGRMFVPRDVIKAGILRQMLAGCCQKDVFPGRDATCPAFGSYTRIFFAELRDIR